MTTLSLLAALSLAACLDDNPHRAPAEAEPGVVYQWTSADGLPFEYRVPKDYDPEQGANLVLVLHGNGLDHRWTFWNHPQAEFRPDDVVVSPDGTTFSESTGANEFLGTQKDADRLHGFLEELKQSWKVRQTFLYGHSQGSFFVFWYAGLYPNDVHGVCGHASGTWMGTSLSKRGHHQAIGFLHGTEDHIPYGQSLGSAREYRKRKYPHVHLRTLFDWDHRPHHFQAAAVLAWAEGVTSDDAARVAVCLEELARPDLPMGANWSALHAVGARLSEMEGASEKQRERGAQIAASVDELAQQCVEQIERSLGRKGKLDEVAADEWVGLLIRCVAELEGAPAWEAFLEQHRRVLDKVQDVGQKAYADYAKEREKDPAKAFAAGLELLRGGYLHHRAPRLLEPMESWAQDRSLKLSKRLARDYERASKAYDKGRRDGFRAFTQLGQRVKLPR